MKNLKLLFTALTVSLLGVSCIVDDTIDNSLAESPLIFGFENRTATNSYFADEGVVTKEYPIVLLGGASGAKSSTDVVLNYAVNTTLSTAIEGVEFDLPGTGTLMMPANSTFVQFPIDINTGSFDANVPTSVFIDLSTEHAGSTVSAINKTIEVKFIGCLATAEQFMYDLEFDYTNLSGVTSFNVAGGIQGMTLFDADGDGTPDANTFLTASTPPWSAGQLAPAPRDGYVFTSLCGDVFIETQQLGDYWGNTVEGDAGSTVATGSIDAVTGDILIDYKVCFAGDCRILKTRYTRQ